jgi:hypothetical protein
MATINHEDEQRVTRVEKPDIEFNSIDKSISAGNQSGLVTDRELQPGGLLTLSGIKSTWNAKSLGLAWAGAIALSFVVAYDQNTYASFAPYATSDFQQLSLLGTIGTIQGVISAGMGHHLHFVFHD